jgi:hypothetical protein
VDKDASDHDDGRQALVAGWAGWLNIKPPSNFACEAKAAEKGRRLAGTDLAMSITTPLLDDLT